MFLDVFIFILKYNWFYNAVLVSGVKQNDCDNACVCVFKLFSIIDYYKLLNIVTLCCLW